MFNPPFFFISASLRIPGSSTTIGEKLEKYTSAVQVSKTLGRAELAWEACVGRRRGVALS